MTEQGSVREDIAFMRELAEAGQAGPMGGGSIVFAGGLIFSLASFAAAYGAANRITGVFYMVDWFGALAVFMAALFILKSRIRARGGAGRATGVAWSGAGSSIFMIVVSLMLMSARANAWWLMGAVAPIILSIYGGTWYAAGVLSRARWCFAVGFGAFAMAAVTAWYATDIVRQFLIYGVSLLALLALPGLAMMRQARSA